MQQVIEKEKLLVALKAAAEALEKVQQEFVAMPDVARRIADGGVASMGDLKDGELEIIQDFVHRDAAFATVMGAYYERWSMAHSRGVDREIVDVVEVLVNGMRQRVSDEENPLMPYMRRMVKDRGAPPGRPERVRRAPRRR